MDISTSTVVGQVVRDGQVVAAFNQFVISLLGLVTTAVATLGGLLIRTKLNAENSTWKQKLAYRLVCYAEQRLSDLGNDGKFDYVANELQKKLGIDPVETKHLVEEAIVKLRTTQSGGPQ